MRGWILLTLGLILIAPTSHAAICYANTSFGSYSYPCDANDPNAAEDSAPWWAKQSTQAILAIVGLVGSAAAGGYAIWRTRRRRKMLSSLLLSIETTYADAKRYPDGSGVAKLTQIRADIRQRHEKGKLDDGNFLELDKRATDYLVRLRNLEIDRRFATLPPLFLNEIRRLLSDGVLTPAEADLVEVRAAAYRIPEGPRLELIELARQWANEDLPQAAEEAVTA